MKMVIVDANAFLGYLLNDIPEQRVEFEKLLVKAKKSEVVLSVLQITVFEIQFVLDRYYEVGKMELIEKLKSIVSASYLDVEDRGVFLSTLKLYEDENVSFVDCFLVSKARSERSDLFTFDRKLRGLVG